MSRHYAGVGARDTPNDMLALMSGVAVVLARKGWVVRSGGAKGADDAFRKGSRRGGVSPELYLPWPGYNKLDNTVYPTMERPNYLAYNVAKRLHPCWGKLRNEHARALMARNSHIILGRYLADPVKFVVCWTENATLDGYAEGSGGTGQALRLASKHKIPVYNLARPDHRAKIERYLEG